MDPRVESTAPEEQSENDSSDAFANEVLGLIHSGEVDSDTEEAAARVRGILARHHPPDDEKEEDDDDDEDDADSGEDSAEDNRHEDSDREDDDTYAEDDANLHDLSLSYLRTLLIRSKLEKIHEVIEARNGLSTYEEIDVASKELAEVIRMQDELDGTGDQWNLMQEQLVLLLRVKAAKEEAEDDGT